MLSDYLTEEIKSKLPTSETVAEHASSQLYAKDNFGPPINENSLTDDESDYESLELSDEDSDVASE